MRGVTSTRQVTRALQMVSAMKMRKAQEQSERSRVYRAGLLELMASFDSPPWEAVPELAAAPSGNHVMLVTYGSDRGLCGPFNSNVLSAVQHLGDEIGRENLEIRCVGVKVGSTLRRRGFNVVSNMRRPAEVDRIVFKQEVGRLLQEDWASGKYRMIKILSTALRGMTVLKPAIGDWLPLAGEPASASKQEKGFAKDFIDEQSSNSVFAAAIRKHLDNEILTALMESEAAEHVARMIAMDNATRNAEELFSRLQLTFNKARQAKITQEICEIVSGANAIRA